MHIESVLKSTYARIDGCQCLVLIGEDGLIVQAAGDVLPEYETIFVEIMGLFKKVAKLLQENGLKSTNSVAINGEISNFLITRVSSTYFLFLAVDPITNTGKSKYELLKAALDLGEEVS